MAVAPLLCSGSLHSTAPLSVCKDPVWLQASVRCSYAALQLSSKIWPATCDKHKSLSCS